LRTAILGGIFCVLGIIAIFTGLLPGADAEALATRVWPILLFVVAITVVTELAAEAGIFTVIAEQLARWGLNRAWLLWILVVALATVSTIFLSLDTTAVLLTPVVVSLAKHVGLPPMPFALTTVWLANTGSLLLPVSNLTNLLAGTRIGNGSPLAFAAVLAVPAAVAIIVPCVILFLVYRRDLVRRFETAERTAPDDRVLLIASAVVVALILPALVSGVAVWIPACIAAIVLGAFFVVRRRSVLSFSLLPWQLVLFAAGLFLVIATATSLGLAGVLATVAGSGQTPLELLRMSGVGATAANLVNNLPAYLALEPTAGSPIRLAALLIGVNAGPLILPWASLATLLWRERLRALDVDLSWPKFIGLGLIAAPLTVGLATLSLAVLAN
jgi:arsenical pump membrane protein